MRTIDLNRQLLGIEDLLIGFGVVTQTRGGQTVSITKINVGSLPFDETQSLLQWAQTVNLAELGAMADELQAIYDSIDALNNLEANLVALNTLAQAINCLNNLCDNLTKLQNIDTNMAKLQNIDTNMTKLQNIDTNMTKLQNIDTNMAKLSSIYSNMSMLQTVYDNMANLNAINTQIIPHLNEILLVDDYATQVSADKTTVANDKASVASMKLAVETIYDTFDDRFLGVKTSDPTLDNDGNPLLDGAMYFNTSVNALKVYDLGNTLWVIIPQIYLSSLLDVTLTSITTGDILIWNGSKWVNTRTPSFTSIKLTGGTGTAGTMTWNNTDFTYDIILNSDVTLQDGQEVLVPCVNSSASLISNGRPVMAVGTNGNSGNILVNLHDGTKANAKRIIGLATQNISANNGFGFVTMIGKVRGINTTGSLYGETWADGDILYVKATGNLTKVVPADSELKMGVAFVLHAHTNGTLYVRVTGVDENADKEFITSMVDIHSKTLKVTPVDADEIMVADSASTFSLKKLTWANIKATLADLFISKVTSTDNAIVRFDGTTGAVQNSGVVIDDNGDMLLNNATNTSTLSLASSYVGNGYGAELRMGARTGSSSASAGIKARHIASDPDLIGLDFFIRNSPTSSTPSFKAMSLLEDGAAAFYGNVGVGVTPSAGARTSSLQVGTGGTFRSENYNGSYNTQIKVIGNGYEASDISYKYIASASASMYNQIAGMHQWSIAPSGTAGNVITWTNAMILNANGSLLVGQQNNAGITNENGVSIVQQSSGTYITVNHINGTASGQLYENFGYNGVQIGSITQSGTTAVAYNTTSDYRLKENVRPADCKKFMDIKFVDYERIDGRHECGVIAHELQEIYPDLVTGEKDATEIRKVEISPAINEVKDEDGNVITEAIEATYEEQEFPVYQQVNYMGLIARIGTVVQQQAKLIEDLKARIEVLENLKGV